MKTIIYVIVILGLIITSGVLEPIIIKEKEYIEKEFANESVAKHNALYENIINPIVENLGQVYITSTFRKPRGSQHSLYEAVDIDNDVIYSISNSDIYRFVKNHMAFHQLIVYHSIHKPTHLHISYKEGVNKGEVLLAKKYWSKKRRRWVTYYKNLN